MYTEKNIRQNEVCLMLLYIFLFSQSLQQDTIIRGSEFLPQIKNYGGITIQNFQTGIQIFVFGLFKKIVLADHLSVFVDDVYYSVSAFHTVTVLLAVISYSLQIYYDFSGYSDMAIGIAKMVGFDFSRNFNLPYIAENISDFWKRWHISLSSWFQEYLYYSLGGSRKGKRRTYFNLVIVMLLSGLWHGAGVTFIVWGLLYGISNCIYKAWKTHRCKNSLKQETVSPIISGVAKLGRITGNFIIVTLFWVVFRAENLRNAVDVWKALFIWHDGIVQIYSWSIFAIVCLIAATIMAFRKAAREGKKYVDGYYPVMDLSRFGSLVVFFTFVGLTIMMGYFGNNAFIYGRF